MHTKNPDELIGLAKEIEKASPLRLNAVIGFDGFVDEVVHVVDKRIDPENYTRVATLSEYGNRLAATAGLSSNVEIVTLSRKIGGNGPILANALMELGVRMSYVGALGYPDIHPVFRNMAERLDAVYSFCEPGATDAVEFDDGKIIRSKLSVFQELNYDNLKARIGLDVLRDVFRNSSLIGFVNWALPPYSGQIWEGIFNDVADRPDQSAEDKTIFFDLADPASRQTQELHSALHIISRYAERYRVILGLNLREAVQVANIFGGRFDFDENMLEEIAAYIGRFVQTDMLVIHPVKESCCIGKEGFVRRAGPYCEKPKLTTGAGDNFNAGFLLGFCLGLPAAHALLLGMASSGFYVRYAKSASLDEIKEFLYMWAHEEIV